jgi:hypothetical protein
METYQRLRAKWLENGIPVNQGIAQGSIECFEQKHGITLPHAFKEYLLTIDGMKKGQVDEELVSFLPLDAIDQESNYREISGEQVDLIFAEYSIFCHWYVLRATRTGDQSGVFAADGEHEKQIARTFEEFVVSYLSSPSKVARCWTT